MPPGAQNENFGPFCLDPVSGTVFVDPFLMDPVFGTHFLETHFLGSIFGDPLRDDFGRWPLIVARGSSGRHTVMVKNRKGSKMPR